MYLSIEKIDLWIEPELSFKLRPEDGLSLSGCLIFGWKLIHFFLAPKSSKAANFG